MRIFHVNKQISFWSLQNKFKMQFLRDKKKTPYNYGQTLTGHFVCLCCQKKKNQQQSSLNKNCKLWRKMIAVTNCNGEQRVERKIEDVLRKTHACITYNNIWVRLKFSQILDIISDILILRYWIHADWLTHWLNCRTKILKWTYFSIVNSIFAQ